jgi:uncharacterized membrane protein YidH (DUF202 family)
VRVTSDSHFGRIRTRLALERTLMAWVRTRVALIGASEIMRCQWDSTGGSKLDAMVAFLFPSEKRGDTQRY